MKNIDEITARLESEADPEFRKKLAHFGVPTEKALGIKVPVVRAIAKEINSGPKNEKEEREIRNHALAMELWETGIHEARTLAPMIASARLLTPADMDRWTADFASWDTCDLCVGNLFRNTAFVYDKIYEYVQSDEEFIRRTGFVMMAELAAVGNKQDRNDRFMEMLPVIGKYAGDERNFVKKAVNWALRQLGKRNKTLYPHALSLAEELAVSDNKTARWIGADARRELKDPKIIARIK